MRRTCQPGTGGFVQTRVAARYEELLEIMSRVSVRTARASSRRKCVEFFHGLRRQPLCSGTCLCMTTGSINHVREPMNNLPCPTTETVESQRSPQFALGCLSLFTKRKTHHFVDELSLRHLQLSQRTAGTCRSMVTATSTTNCACT